ncbi:hypothetical protein GUJ93_ZPchr0006g44981 [Zizania palustris]|uniref:Uncharacterized protein n=1 Tax=Zizania palustris TaxID=103762 RepID=A0A8J5SUX4_ZIZPA|nr:hypothetical protein GUJ93_ZPchr0006g44981 [Zizania palustris]
MILCQWHTKCVQTPEHGDTVDNELPRFAYELCSSAITGEKKVADRAYSFPRCKIKQNLLVATKSSRKSLASFSLTCYVSIESLKIKLLTRPNKSSHDFFQVRHIQIHPVNCPSLQVLIPVHYELT